MYIFSKCNKLFNSCDNRSRFKLFAGLKRVAWPPPPEDQDFDFVEQGPVQAKVNFIIWKNRVKIIRMLSDTE